MNTPPSPSSTDRDLLAALRQGPAPDAFAEIVKRHAPLALSAARRILGDAHLAEDAVQAAFLVLSQKAPTLPESTVLAGWLYATTQLAARNMRRERVRRERREDTAMAERTRASTGKETSSVAEQDELWRALRPELDAALDELPRPQRDAVLLRCLEQRSPADSARELHISEAALSMRLSRGLDTLRGKLMRRGVEATSAMLMGLCALNGTEALTPTLTQSLLGISSNPAAVSAAATASAKGVVKAMFLTKLKLYAAASLALALLGGGSFYLAHAEDNAPPARPTQPQGQAQPNPRPMPGGGNGANVQGQPAPKPAEGLQASLVAKKNAYVIGEKLEIALVLKNTTDKKLVLLKPFGPGDFRFCLSATVMGPNGKALDAANFPPQQNARPGGISHGGTDEDYVELDPGQEYRAELFSGFEYTGMDKAAGVHGAFGHSYYKLDSAGEYSFKVQYDSTIQPYGPLGAQKFPKQRWLGKLETETLKLTIAAK